MPVFLEVEQASESVLEPVCGQERLPRYDGQRVAQGHRLTHSASDVFLGLDRPGEWIVHFHVRQLRDAKIEFAIEAFGSAELMLFAEWCALRPWPAPTPAPASLLIIAGYSRRGRHLRPGHRGSSRSPMPRPEAKRPTKRLTKAVRAGKLEALVERGSPGLRWKPRSRCRTSLCADRHQRPAMGMQAKLEAVKGSVHRLRRVFLGLLADDVLVPIDDRCVWLHLFQAYPLVAVGVFCTGRVRPATDRWHRRRPCHCRRRCSLGHRHDGDLVRAGRRSCRRSCSV